ncbi:MAG: hypothetical protein IT434_11775 [Phycisphaerales bacterium]|nr:hypothetical protein [Phycisphaerales bacterium]
MRLTPLGKLVVVAIVLFVAWKLFVHSDFARQTHRSLARAEITPIDIMVFTALGFVSLLVVLGRFQPPSASSS